MSEHEPRSDESLGVIVSNHVIDIAIRYGASPDEAAELMRKIADRDALKELPEEANILRAIANSLQPSDPLIEESSQ